MAATDRYGLLGLDVVTACGYAPGAGGSTHGGWPLFVALTVAAP